MTLRTHVQIGLGAVLLVGVVIAGRAQAIPAAKRPILPVARPVAAADHGETPERVFQSQCSRCHYAPETLNPRLTGTVVRHMRVRANLSAEQERLILRYLNP